MAKDVVGKIVTAGDKVVHVVRHSTVLSFREGRVVFSDFDGSLTVEWDKVPVNGYLRTTIRKNFVRVE